MLRPSLFSADHWRLLDRPTRIHAVCQTLQMVRQGVPASGTQRWWRKTTAWLGVKNAEGVINALWTLGALTVVGWITIARAWIAREWACIQQAWCEVRGWSLGLLLVSTLALAVGICLVASYALKLRARLRTERAASAGAPSSGRTAQPALAAERPPPFQPIPVADENLHLDWHLCKPPDHWLSLDPGRLAPSYVQEILDGPFHATCHERLEESFGDRTHGVSPTLGERCPGCGAQLFNVRAEPLESQLAGVWTVRSQALGELQRMHRGGTEIKGPRLVLANPQYWRKLRPPR